MIYPYSIMDVILRVHCTHTAILWVDHKLGEYRVKVLYNYTSIIPIKVSVFRYINKLYHQVGFIKRWSDYNYLENKKYIRY